MENKSIYRDRGLNKRQILEALDGVDDSVDIMACMSFEPLTVGELKEKIKDLCDYCIPALNIEFESIKKPNSIQYKKDFL